MSAALPCAATATPELIARIGVACCDGVPSPRRSPHTRPACPPRPPRRRPPQVHGAVGLRTLLSAQHTVQLSPESSASLVASWQPNAGVGLQVRHLPADRCSKPCVPPHRPAKRAPPSTEASPGRVCPCRSPIAPPPPGRRDPCSAAAPPVLSALRAPPTHHHTTTHTHTHTHTHTTSSSCCRPRAVRAVCVHAPAVNIRQRRVQLGGGPAGVVGHEPGPDPAHRQADAHGATGGGFCSLPRSLRPAAACRVRPCSEQIRGRAAAGAHLDFFGEHVCVLPCLVCLLNILKPA